MDALTKAILFRSEKFDCTSDLPENDNVGNRLYGGDLAQFLCARLKAKGLDAGFLDEDWGWLVFGKAAPSTSFEIAVYQFSEPDEGSCPGAPEWGLRMQAFQRRNLLGIWPSKRRIHVPPAIEAAIMDAIDEIGASPREWEEAPPG